MDDRSAIPLVWRTIAAARPTEARFLNRPFSTVTVTLTPTFSGACLVGDRVGFLFPPSTNLNQRLLGTTVVDSDPIPLDLMFKFQGIFVLFYFVLFCFVFKT